MSFRCCVLASGSGGNAALVWTDSTRILVDAGLSLRELHKRLQLIGQDLERVDVICLSHSHSDHVLGVPVLARNRAVRAQFCATPGTVEALNGALIDANVHQFAAGESFEIGDITVQSFPVMHDAVEPCAFTFTAGGTKIGIAIDLGSITDEVVRQIDGVDLLALEANHDSDMLAVCGYPLVVKRRVAASTGHLSNAKVAAYLEANLKAQTKRIVLCHLSSENNHPRLAALTAAAACKRAGHHPDVVIAEQGRPTEVFEL